MEFLVTHNILCKAWGGLESGPIYPSCGEERIFLSNNTPHTFRTPPAGSTSKAKTEFFHPYYIEIGVRYDLAASRFPPRYHAQFDAFEPLPVESVMDIQRFALSNKLEMNRLLPAPDWGTVHLSIIASRYLPRAYIEQREIPDLRDLVARIAEHNRWVFGHYRQHPGSEPDVLLRRIDELEIANAAYEKLIYQILDVYDVNGPQPDWSRAQGPAHEFDYDEYQRDRKALEGIFPYVPRMRSLDQLERIVQSEE